MMKEQKKRKSMYTHKKISWYDDDSDISLQLTRKMSSHFDRTPIKFDKLFIETNLDKPLLKRKRQ